MTTVKLIRIFIATLIIAVAVIAYPVSAQASTSGCAPNIGKRTPVILVHGLNSNGSTWGSTDDPNSMISAISNLVPNMYVDQPFDYHKDNKDWVDNPNIGPALAQRIVCLATVSRQAGGSGKVIAIGHSMGGLAIRYAATMTPIASEVVQDLGLVITIGTPNIGSGWANLGTAFQEAICTPEDLHGNTPKAPSDSPCALSALWGLSNRSQRVEALSWLPSTVPVLAIAGDVTLTYPLFMMTLKHDTKAGLVVSEKSALEGMEHSELGGGQVTVSCSVSIGTLDLIAHAILEQTVLPVCWHSALTHNQIVESATVNAIKKYLASIEFASYIGSWHVHTEILTINVGQTGLQSWNAGACTQSLSDTRMCNGNAKIIFTVNLDGSIKGTIQSVWYTQWDGEPYAGMPPAGAVVQAGDSFELQHDGAHLLYTTWLGNQSHFNNEGSNRYLCDVYAENAGWYQCG